MAGGMKEGETRRRGGQEVGGEHRSWEGGRSQGRLCQQRDVPRLRGPRAPRAGRG